MRRYLLAALVAVPAVCGCHDPDADLPRPYRTVTVPARVVEPSSAARRSGRGLFLQNCALCHGEGADGRGARHSALSTKPVDFTQRTWCRETTPRQVFHAIREGVRGTAMPAWRALDEEQSWDLVAYLLSVCEQGAEVEPSS